MKEQAIDFVMKFYSISRETALELYMDEVEAYERFLQRSKDDECDSV